MRNPSVDAAKGVAILFVIIGHLAVLPMLHLQRLAYTFHIPLFFILAGCYFSPKPFMKAFAKDFKRLIIPFIITLTACFVMKMIFGDKLFFQRMFNALVGRRIFTADVDFFPNELSQAGILWFLPAFFWCKIIYNELSRRLIKAGVSYIISIIAIIFISVGVTWCERWFIIPFHITAGCSFMLYYAIGDGLKHLILEEKQWKGALVIAAALWGASYVLPTDYSIEGLNPWSILGVTGAIGATIVIIKLCKMLKGTLSKALQWCGINSMGILCLHYMCFMIGGVMNIDILNAMGNGAFIIHILISIGGTYILTKIPATKRIYQLA